MARLTQAQGLRADARDDRTGRFIKNPCSCCGRAAPMDYCSHNMTDETDANGEQWRDIALVLCNRCAKATDSFKLVAEYRAYQAKVAR